MKQQIILSLADFSANNIGKLVDIDPLTRAVLSKQTQYQEGSSEVTALDNFIKALKSDGFIGGENPKFSVLMIPALAATQAELFFNLCALDGNGDPTNWMPANDSASYKLVSSDGHNIGAYVEKVVGASSTINAFNLNLGNYFVGNQLMPSFCIFNYLVDTFTSADRIMAGYNYSINIKHSASDCSISTGGTVRASATTVMTTTEKGFYAFAYDSATGAILLNNKGNTAATSSPASGGITPTGIGYINDNFPLIYGNTNPIGATHSAIIGFGKGMTQAEMATLKGYCDTLATALHIQI